MSKSVEISFSPGPFTLDGKPTWLVHPQNLHMMGADEIEDYDRKHSGGAERSDKEGVFYTDSYGNQVGPFKGPSSLRLYLKRAGRQG